jgi:hypothetical protein
MIITPPFPQPTPIPHTRSEILLLFPDYRLARHNGRQDADVCTCVNVEDAFRLDWVVSRCANILGRSGGTRLFWVNGLICSFFQTFIRDRDEIRWDVYLREWRVGGGRKLTTLPELVDGAEADRDGHEHPL